MHEVRGSSPLAPSVLLWQEDSKGAATTSSVGPTIRRTGIPRERRAPTRSERRERREASPLAPSVLLWQEDSKVERPPRSTCRGDPDGRRFKSAEPSVCATTTPRAGSSVVEQLAHNQLVAGSIPARPTFHGEGGKRREGVSPNGRGHASMRAPHEEPQAGEVTSETGGRRA